MVASQRFLPPVGVRGLSPNNTRSGEEKRAKRSFELAANGHGKFHYHGRHCYHARQDVITRDIFEATALHLVIVIEQLGAIPNFLP